MLTVTKLARRCGVSRTALLYYESIGLMPPPQRSGGNYRCYSDADTQRLLHIRAYRKAGLTLEDIRTILKTQTGKKHSGPRGADAPGNPPAHTARVLKPHLLEQDTHNKP